MPSSAERVSREALPDVWKQYSGLISKALRADPRYEEVDIANGVFRGDLDLWVGPEQAAIAQFAEYPTGRFYVVIAVAGENVRPWLVGLAKEIEQYAADNDCRAVAVHAHRGWESLLDGYRRSYKFFLWRAI